MAASSATVGGPRRPVVPAAVRRALGGMAVPIGSVFFTPLIMTGVAVALPFRAGLFNIGAEGQLLAGSVACTVIGVKFSSLPAPIRHGRGSPAFSRPPSARTRW